jgi:hypothetical protein
MRPLILEKIEAIRLRKKGFSYREILEVVPVAKSTLSVWLENEGLTDEERAVLKRRRDDNISVGRIRAAASLHRLKLDRDAILLIEAKQEFENFKNDSFFHTGLALYWAEGSKRSNTFTFVNSDCAMIVIMLDWMERFLGVKRTQVSARLYLHKPYAHENCEKYWSNSIGIPVQNFRRTIYKPTGLLIKKRPNYMGCLRIEVGKVTYFRKYQFWQKMMLEDYKKQG